MSLQQISNNASTANIDDFDREELARKFQEFLASDGSPRFRDIVVDDLTSRIGGIDISSTAPATRLMIDDATEVESETAVEDDTADVDMIPEDAISSEEVSDPIIVKIEEVNQDVERITNDDDEQSGCRLLHNPISFKCKPANVSTLMDIGIDVADYQVVRLNSEDIYYETGSPHDRSGCHCQNCSNSMSFRDVMWRLEFCNCTKCYIREINRTVMSTDVSKKIFRMAKLDGRFGSLKGGLRGLAQKRDIKELIVAAGPRRR